MGESKVAEAQPATSYHEDIFGDPNIVMDKDQMLQLLDSPDSNSLYPNTSENLKVCMKRFCPWFVCCWYYWWVSQQAINDVCRLHVVHTFNQTPDFWLILLAYNSHTGLQRLFSHSVALDFRGYIDAMTERCRLFDTKYFLYTCISVQNIPSSCTLDISVDTAQEFLVELCENLWELVATALILCLFSKRLSVCLGM